MPNVSKFRATKPRIEEADVHVRVGSEAPFWKSADDFRFAPISRHFQSPSACLKGANNGSKPVYSITSSACPLTTSGTVMPSALAVLRLMMSP